MRRLVICVVAALVTAIPVGFPTAGTAADPPLHLQDRAFMAYALEQDLAQVRFGEMAAGKSADPDVKRIAASTAEYHRGSSERLQAAASRLGVKPPAVLNPVAQRTEASLKDLSGPGFDRAYLTSVVIASYNGMYSARRQMEHGFDPGLKAEGRRQAEELRDHRRAAERIARRLDEAAPGAGGMNAEDRNFLLYAMHVDMAQRGFAEVAASRATDTRVRGLARELVDYHTRSLDRLRKVAMDRNMEPLTEISALSSGTRERIRAMDDGLAADWAFLNAHAFTSYGAHYRYERESLQGGDPEIRRIAAEAARDARRQHWRALRIMNDWQWTPRAR